MMRPDLDAIFEDAIKDAIAGIIVTNINETTTMVTIPSIMNTELALHLQQYV
jgi:hypothetical protein